MNEKKSGWFKFFKIMAYCLVTLFFILLIGIALLFYHLPDAQQIGGFFKNDSSVKKQNMQQETQAKKVNDVASTTTDQDPSVSADSEVEEETSEDLEKVKKSLDEFIDPNSPRITFCNHFDKAKSGKISLTPENTKKYYTNAEGKKIEIKSDIHFDESEDLRFQAVKPLLKTILQKPNMSSLVKMVLDDEESLQNSSSGIFKKADFYRQAYLAYAEMKANIGEYEAVMDRAYIMYKMNDLIVFKNELKTDQRLIKFCEDQEQLFNTNQPVQIDNEKKAFERLLQEFQVRPEDINYKADYKTAFSLDFSENNLKMSGGWVEEIVESSPVHSKK